MAAYLFALVPLLLLLMAPNALASKHMVQILNSTTGQLVTSTTLEWQTFTADDKQLRFAVEAGHFVVDAETQYPMFVCRLNIDGLMTVGHTTKPADDRWACVVAIYTSVKNHFNFEILVNIGGGAKLKWQPWNTHITSTPRGAVSEVSTGHVSVIFKY